MSRPRSAERIHFAHPADLPGVRVLAVRESWHRWSLFHESYALTLVQEGHGSWSYRRRRREIAPASLMLIEPGNVHVTTEVASPAGFDTLFIDPRVLVAAARNCGLPDGLPHFATLDTHDPALVALFGRLHAAIADPGREALERTQLQEEALFALFRLAGEACPRDEEIPRASLLRARELVHDCYQRADGAKPVSIDDLASAVGLAPIRLIRGFKTQFGLPPYQYLVRLRLARAQALIERGPGPALRSLTDVALEAGFWDLAHMDKCFQRFLRLSPSDYARGAGTHDRWAVARRPR